MSLEHVTPGMWGFLAALIALSGCFSATETALFSLHPNERPSAGSAARQLLDNQRDLLVTVLLANLLVNVTFFAFALRVSSAAVRSPREEVVVGVAALFTVVIFGEILPKTVGLRANLVVARVLGPPLLLLVLLSGPLTRAVSSLLEVTTRFVKRGFRERRKLTPEALAEVLERSAERGVLHATEADFLTEIVELDDIRVREIMTPRVDLLFLDTASSEREETASQALDKRLSWLPVVDGGPDRVIGRVAVRDLINQPDRPMSQLVMPVKFVPEVASALDLLHGLREARVAEAVVVDEWGGTAGVVTIEDIFEEIVGELREEEELIEPPAIPLGEGRFRVSGGLSIRDWNEQFGERVVPNEFETVGGFVTALLGRIPRHGDAVTYGQLAMEVHEVRGRRVLSVDMHLVSGEGAQA